VAYDRNNAPGGSGVDSDGPVPEEDARARMGPPLQLTDEDLDRLAEIQPEDIERAQALWDSVVK
jgi:hypothetical protein